jgi:hypothetical protein
MVDLSEFGTGEEGLTDYEYLLQHNAVFRQHRGSMMAAFDFVQRGLYDAAHETWEELPHDAQTVLNRATSKGGTMWPHERSIIVKGVDPTTGWCYGLAGVHSAVE